MSHANTCTVHALFAFPFASWATGTWTSLVLWLTRYPLEGWHGGLSAAYFPIAVMWSMSQVPSRPPTFPLYKARSPGSVTALRGKLWNRTAGPVSGRADSAVGLLLIPYYPACLSSFFLFLITISLHPLLWSHSLHQNTVSLFLSVDARKPFSAPRQRGTCVSCANTPDSSSCSANCLAVCGPIFSQHVKNK